MLICSVFALIAAMVTFFTVKWYTPVPETGYVLTAIYKVLLKILIILSLLLIEMIADYTLRENYDPLFEPC